MYLNFKSKHNEYAAGWCLSHCLSYYHKVTLDNFISALSCNTFCTIFYEVIMF